MATNIKKKNKARKENTRPSKRPKREGGGGINYEARIMLLLLFSVVGVISVGFFRVLHIKANGKDYEKAAIYNQLNKVQDKVISPNRGDILDRNGQQLAVGETVFNIIFDVRLCVMQKPEKQRETLEKINSILGIPMDELEGYIATNAEGVPAKDTNYFVIAKKVSFEKGKKINDLGYNWLYGEQDTKRSYPKGMLASQIIGFIRGDSFWGLESSYNDYMTGVPGRTFRTYESGGSVVTQREPAKKGNKIVTTIDSEIQSYAQEVCKTAYDEYSPEYSVSVVMNPQTGEIYAMAQYPTFDPNDPMEKISQLEDPELYSAWEQMSDEEKTSYATKSWKNFTITETFEPGSIYKPIVAAMALEENAISKDDTFYCGGSMTVAEHVIHCHNRAGHGSLTLNGVLAQSCNVGMMQIITKLGAEKYLKYQRDFGFGETTGIDLPGEVSASNLLYTEENLHTAEMATSSFGQGFNCTPIQALTAFAALINGGKILRPYIVSQVMDDADKVIYENKPCVLRRVISKETSDYIRVALEDVLTEGTGKKAVIQGYVMGGKTGTAQQSPRSEQKYTLSFIAYHSVENPNLMLMTLIHKPKDYNDEGGEASPVPMLKSLMEKIIKYEAIPADVTTGEENESTSNGYTVKDYTNKNLKTTIQELINEGIDFEIIGSGDTIANQSPAGGTKLESKVGMMLFNITQTNKDIKLVPVPDVSGMNADDARRMLELSGFGCSVSVDNGDVETDEEAVTDTDTETNSEEEDTQEEETVVESKTAKVYAQMPSANVKIEEGTTVKIKVK
ncbi:MAG: PASTA domain-containing protein [Firmicutes bacterium]|nr:PASTA domain-containing protein [Bacillota bacterium]